MQTILITGGRAPVALDFARKFKQMGWRVLVAESMAVHLCQNSRAVDDCFTVPSPRFEPNKFIATLCHIIQQENVDLLLPTCEEVFTIGKGYQQLSQYCTVFTEPIERLLPLHSKAQFIYLARRYHLPVPETTVIKQRIEAEQYIRQSVVLKAEFSRFATETIIKPKNYDDIKMVDVSKNRQWVAQEFIEGQQICTYSIVHQGKITAHVAYSTEITAGQGATIAFKALHHPASEAWVEKFVGCYEFTGQIAFDFIETPFGEIFAIECNPRAISAVHLFDEKLIPAIVDKVAVAPDWNKGVAVWLAVLFYGWQSATSLKQWRRTLLKSRDVIFSWRDPLPFFTQFSMLWHVMKLSRKENLSLIEGTTYDIEWNHSLEEVQSSPPKFPSLLHRRRGLNNS